MGRNKLLGVGRQGKAGRGGAGGGRGNVTLRGAGVDHGAFGRGPPRCKGRKAWERGDDGWGGCRRAKGKPEEMR